MELVKYYKNYKRKHNEINSFNNLFILNEYFKILYYTYHRTY